MRSIVAAVAGAMALALLLLAYSAPRLGLPWSSEQIALTPAGFETVSGSATPHGDALRLSGRIADGRTVVAVPVRFDAGSHRFLDYAFAGFPPSLRLMLGWRSSAEPQRWQWAPLPQPPASGATVTVDLGRLLPEWSGEVQALGFSIAAAEFLPAAAAPAHDLRLTRVRLRSDGRAAALAALLDEWILYRPWSGRSINTGGFDLRYHAPRPWSGFALAAGVVLLLVFAVLGWRRPRRVRAVLLAGCVLWLLLDVAQLRMLAMRAAHAQALAALAPEGLRTEPGIAAAMDAVRGRVAAGEGARKLVVLGGNAFLLAYPVYELLPLNAAGVPAGQFAAAPAGTLLLRLGGIGAHDADADTLTLAGQRLPVRLLYGQPGIQLFEIGAAAGERP